MTFYGKMKECKNFFKDKLGSMLCTAAAVAVEEEGGGLGLTPGSLQE